jgi:hypothetical protein
MRGISSPQVQRVKYLLINYAEGNYLIDPLVLFLILLAQVAVLLVLWKGFHYLNKKVGSFLHCLPRVISNPLDQLALAPKGVQQLGDSKVSPCTI